MNKELIKSRFAKNLETYEANAFVQKKMAQKLLDMLNQTSYERILEIGCGTGFLTRIANEKLIFKTYSALDIVPNCQTYISKINPSIKFIQGDIEKFIIDTTEQYDLIVSNATLQWIKDFPSFAQKILSKLHKNGVLLFSTFGTENYKEICNIMGKSLEYLPPKKYKEIFKNYSHQIEEDIEVIEFTSVREILKHMQYTGVNSIEKVFWTKSDMFKFEKEYNNYCLGSPVLTYNPIFIKIENI